MRQSADFRFKLRAPKSLHLLESCTNLSFPISVSYSEHRDSWALFDPVVRGVVHGVHRQ